LRTITIQDYNIYADDIATISINEHHMTVINTINAHSYIVAKTDKRFKKALTESDILLPDGEGIVFMASKIKKENINKIAGADIHEHLLNIAEQKKLKCFYLGSSQTTLQLIKEKLENHYKNIRFGFFSPPFKTEFTDFDNRQMISKVNAFQPDVLFVGMTAPKQEKWVFENKKKIKSGVICSIGAVFDFIAETKKRAPNLVIKLKMEWLYRSFTAWRLTKRYLYSTPLFLWEVIKQKYFSKSE
jgi:N-acetylglucosaminyldiphosphoundecaprenol N-acetyl-beta-D-mannosaminyltransferase|tara:strand:- start:2260 stop:2991 length:732 start_codon:yes stop_codon:yes gene_type:complete